MPDQNVRPVAKPPLKTPQELVHIRHRISLRQYKYWILMLRSCREAHEARKAPDRAGFHRIAMADLVRYLGYKPMLAELRADLEAIRKEPIIYNVLGKDGQQAMRGAGFISEWELAAGGLAFKLPTFLVDCVERLDLKSAMFQALNWSVFNSFSGKYEAILYKLCRDYVGIARTPTMTVSAFRDYMGLGDEEYGDFKRLNQWVISGPIKKINASELSDINLGVEFRREGRRIVGLWFNVEQKQQTVLDFGDAPAFRLARVSIPIAQQKRFLAEQPAEVIELSIRRANEYADSKTRKGETIDLGAVYHTAIRQDWGKAYQSKLQLESEKRTKQTAARQAAADAVEAEHLRAQFESEWRSRANTALAATSPAHVDALYRQWQDEVRPISALLQQGPSNELFRAWARLQLVGKPTAADFAAWRGTRTRSGSG